MTAEIESNPVRFLRLSEVKHMTGLGKTAVYERIRDGVFPTSIKLGGRAVGWIEGEIAQ